MIYPQCNAQQLHGFARICINPSFFLSKKYNRQKGTDPPIYVLLYMLDGGEAM